MKYLGLIATCALLISCAETAPELEEVADAGREVLEAGPDIGDIVEGPSAYLMKSVEVEGEVVNMIDGEETVYRLQNETGSIIVVSAEPAPAVGSELAVEGVVEQNVVLNGTPFDVVIRESVRDSE